MTVSGSWERAARGAMLLGSNGNVKQTIFAEMSASRPAPARSTSARASRTRTAPPRCSRPPRQRSPTESNQYPPGQGHARAAGGDRRAPAAFYGLAAGPATEVLVTPAPPRRSPPRMLALVEAGRRGASPSSRSTTPTAPSSRSPARTHVHRAAACPRISCPTWTRSRAAVQRPHPGHPGQRSAQPDRRGVPARGARARRRARRSEHDAVIVTDEVYEHLTFERAARPDRDAARGGGAHADHLLGRQDVLLHRLEDRLALRPGGARGRAPDGQAVPELRHGAPFQPAIAVGLGLPDAFFADTAATLARQAGPALRGARSRPASRSRHRGRLLRGGGCRRARIWMRAALRRESSPNWRAWSRSRSRRSCTRSAGRARLVAALRLLQEVDLLERACRPASRGPRDSLV